MHTRTSTPSTDPLIGKTILSFRIERKLAEGGMGAVYVARHEELSNTLKVLKVLLPVYAEDPVIRQRFRREAEAASLLRHDKILGVDNYGVLDDGQLFMMVPFLDGEPLDVYLHKRGGRLAPHRALHLVVQLCDALDHAHARGVVHRDLKPGNVFIVATSENPYLPKILDFGIAKLLGSREVGPKTQRGAAIGTPGYMAVEQYEHADEVTAAADVYALAVMTWEIVTGRRPWAHIDYALLYFQQRTVIPERPPIEVMPADWADALLRALSVDPGARPTARELAVALASALPAIGRVPSGAEILTGLAPHFVRRTAPDDDTVRNASEVDRIGPLLWPARETEPGGLAAPSAEARAQRPAPVAEPSTTLAAATGVTNVRIERPVRWRLALAAVATAILTALATVALATRATTGAISPAITGPGGPGTPPSGAELLDANANRAPAAAPPAVALPAPPQAASRPPASPPPAPTSAASRDAIPQPPHASAREPGAATPPPRAAASAPAASEPARARGAFGDGARANSAEPVQADAKRPRKPLLADPDDVVGPEM